MGVTGVIQTGTYTIQNVTSTGYATLQDSNRGSPLIATTSGDSDDIKFNVTKVSNNKYTIASYVWANYAYVGGSPNKGDRVAGRSDSFQWEIKETNKKGDYLIYSDANDSVFWGFENSNANTAVKLTSDEGKAKWNFNRINT